ncbi:MAG: hypothetical protein K0S55_1974 [Clostridia bacterium]|nr:hypothetical protein [Clostridia bacterium]
MELIVSDNNIPVKEIGEMLDEVSSKLPKLINGLMSSLYSAEAGKNMGQAVGCFYKELLEAGIPVEDALKMAKDYMLSLKDLSSSFK